jgi:hypothetical protein
MHPPESCAVVEVAYRDRVIDLPAQLLAASR